MYRVKRKWARGIGGVRKRKDTKKNEHVGEYDKDERYWKRSSSFFWEALICFGFGAPQNEILGLFKAAMPTQISLSTPSFLIHSTTKEEQKTKNKQKQKDSHTNKNKNKTKKKPHTKRSYLWVTKNKFESANCECGSSKVEEPYEEIGAKKRQESGCERSAGAVR